ncbi:uncharacterized protein EDB91DRAFT_1270713 [Suillus paluster]|uniref:uncharacterized protein n=1 Tax=Suillus paluster TaxID=48578 RepID=UPI001B873369|nr:uncharacterized protein EDB91DRAFT_1270713 [Suillus paluster]KAG1723717.1 hypothetical protein EDB91DRAFT_1270713 [Suillus paluster]
MLWENVLLDVQKAIELNASSRVAYQVKHAALHGAQRYDEAITAFEMMLVKLDGAHDIQIRSDPVSVSEAEGVLRKAIDVQLDTARFVYSTPLPGFYVIEKRR